MYRKYMYVLILVICTIHLISAKDIAGSYNEKATQRIVFVHVQSALPDEANQEIRELVKKICQHTVDEVIEILDGNVLSINLNPIDDTIEITDRFQILTDNQLRILEMNMMELLTVVDATTTLHITIAWL